MKILMLCEFYNENLEFQENLLVKYYRKYGHEVTVITSTYESVFDYYNNIHKNNSPRKDYQDHGANIIKLPFQFNYFGKVKKYHNIATIAEDFQPDLLYIHDIMPNMLELIPYMKKNPKAKMIMDYHADYSNSANNWMSLHILHKIVRKYLYMMPIRKYISKFFPIIPDSLTFLEEVYGIEKNKMEVLPLGADCDRVEEILKSNIRQEIRDQLKIADHQKAIFSGGKFTPLKQNHLLIEAFHLINNENLHLIIVGDSDEENQAYKQQMLTLANNHPNIHFVGWLKNDQVYQHLAASDLAVFPSSQSIVWLQALASGLPLIVGDLGRQSLDYINEFGSILELETKDISAQNIKLKIEEIIHSESKYKELKESTIKTKEKYLDWNHLINRTLQFNQS